MKQAHHLVSHGLLATAGLALFSCQGAGPEWAARERDAASGAAEPGQEEPAAEPAAASVEWVEPGMEPQVMASIVLCHTPPDDPYNPYTIWAPFWAVKEHLAHGDHLGPCQGGKGGCLSNGKSCTFDHQCCSGSCYYGVCSPMACLPAGKACTFDHQCCGGSCQAGTCGDGQGGCLPAGQSCTFNHQCCSGSCWAGVCEP